MLCGVPIRMRWPPEVSWLNSCRTVGRSRRIRSKISCCRLWWVLVVNASGGSGTTSSNGSSDRS
ncbi:hypothetical protein D3C80_2090450 [compost metagenome]